MRERLIDLIQTSVGGCARHWAEVIADGLIDSGVIVPPCKVGDDVYHIIDGKIQELRVDYGTFGKIDFTMSARCKEEAALCEYSCSEGKTCGIGFGYSDIGKTVFLTREDAERALKGSD